MPARASPAPGSADPYRVHQRLRLAFPGTGPGRILFRIEDEWQRPHILVQAEAEAVSADGLRGFRGARLSRPAEARGAEARSGAGAPLSPSGQPHEAPLTGSPGEKVNGPRVGLFREVDQRAWLQRKAQAAGFEILSFDVSSPGTSVSRKNPAKDRSRQAHLAVRFDGRLRVRDPEALSETLRRGIGSAKGYGFGLLSLAP